MNSSSNNILVYTGCFLVIAGIVFAILGHFHNRSAKTIVKSFKRIAASCVEHRPNLASKTTTSTLAVLKYKFRGKVYYYIPNTAYGDLAPIGAKRIIYINPLNPKECYEEDYFDEFSRLLWFGVVLTIFGVLVLCFSSFL